MRGQVAGGVRSGLGHCNRSITLAIVAALVLWLAVASPAAAQPGKDKDELSFDRNIRGLISRYCYKCHDSHDPDGDVDLQTDENPRMIANNREVWLTALERIEKGEMPPEDARQPTDEERQLIVKFLKQTVNELDCDDLHDPGRPRLRRLNRVEYNHSIQYLTGLDLRPADDFPPDPNSYGFDVISDTLTLSPAQVERYPVAARKVVAALLASPVDAAYQQVFFVQPSDQVAARDAASQIIRRFTKRAFRRPVEDEFIDRLLSVYDFAIDAGQSHQDATGHMLAAVLMSPRFLMRAEQNRPDSDAAYPVDPYDLASRLSFFLWSSPPDETLLALAESGEISKPEVLEQQTLRMLKDERSGALAENFFGQWLQVRELQSHRPDVELFPEFDESLAESMRQEVFQYVGDMLRNDASLTALIESDYTFLNARLAEHYDVDGIQGDAFRRVSLPTDRRGGVLTMAAILMQHSDPDRTNVPRRGNFIAGTILGAPAPPPPADVPALAATQSDGKSQSLRELLEQHRQDAQCASCHDKIDPLGFALENYDAIGRWRKQESGRAIDASGRLSDGRAFDGSSGLKAILLEDEGRDAFTATLTKNLLIYALGRGPELADQCVIDEAVEQARKKDYRISVVITTIVKSFLFTHRRNPEF